MLGRTNRLLLQNRIEMRFVVAILQPRLPLLKPWNLNQLTNIINFLSYSITIFLHLSAKNKLAFPYTRGPVRIRGRDLIGDWKLYGTKRYGNAIQSSLNWKPSTKCGRTQWRDCDAKVVSTNIQLGVWAHAEALKQPCSVNSTSTSIKALSKDLAGRRTTLQEAESAKYAGSRLL